MLSKRLRDLQIFLGPTRSRALILWLALTGLVSLMLNAIVNQYDWVRPVQSLLVIVFLVGAAFIVGGRMRPEERTRWLGILIPALIALVIGAVIVPQYSLALTGGALGWIAAGLLLTRSRMPLEYKQAIRHLRKNEYAEAVKIMDGVIKDEPDVPNHYRFRAEILRVWGKLDRAVRDYRRMTELAPESAVAFNGLSEVCVQMRDYASARAAALKANQLEPDNWVTYYNLGMIDDRLRNSTAVVEHLRKALALKVPDTRHRVLIHLYLARAYSRLGDLSAAQEQVQALKRLPAGLEEWQTIMDSDQAETLRAALGDDVQVAQALVSGDLEVAALGRGQ